MRVAAILALLSLLAAPALRAEDEVDGPAAVSEEEAVAVLEDFVRLVRAEEQDAASGMLDAARFVERAFAVPLAEADEARRALVVDLVRRGVLHMRRREPMPWNAPDVAIDDYRASPRPDGTVEATFRWSRAGRAHRFGVLVAPTAAGPTVVDLVSVEASSTLTWSAVLAEGFAAWGPGVGGLEAFLRFYFDLPRPETVVPPDAPVDWASPEALALDLVEPLVPDAAPDGWYAQPVPVPGLGTRLVYRLVVHVLADGSAHWRSDPMRLGGAQPLLSGSLAPGFEREITLGALGTLTWPVLIRADHRTPFSAVRALLERVDERAVGEVAFTVRRGGAGGPRWGQVAVRAGGEAPVAPTRAALRARGGFGPSQSPSRAAPEVLAVRLVSRVSDADGRSTWVVVDDAPPWRLPPLRAAAFRAAVLEEIVASLARRLGAEGPRTRLTIEVPAPVGDDVPHGDVVELLCALRRGFTAVDLSIERRARRGPPTVDAEPEVAYELPPGWVEGPRRPMRTLSFKPAGSTSADGYVTVLPGDAGGWRANVRRWYAMMGAAPPDDEALDAVARWEIDGRTARFVAIPGSLRGLDEDEEQTDLLLLGLVLPADACTVFVKLVGRRSEIEAQRERFEAFCRSLRVR